MAIETTSAPAETFKELRMRMSYGQAELARELGIVPETVWGWENRGRMPLPKYRRKLAEILGVDLALLNNPAFWAQTEPAE